MLGRDFELCAACILRCEDGGEAVNTFGRRAGLQYETGTQDSWNTNLDCWPPDTFDFRGLLC